MKAPSLLVSFLFGIATLLLGLSLSGFTESPNDVIFAVGVLGWLFVVVGAAVSIFITSAFLFYVMDSAIESVRKSKVVPDSRDNLKIWSGRMKSDLGLLKKFIMMTVSSAFNIMYTLKLQRDAVGRGMCMNCGLVITSKHIAYQVCEGCPDYTLPNQDTHVCLRCYSEFCGIRNCGYGGDPLKVQ